MMDNLQARLALIEHRHQILLESRGHIDHPEDSVFSGSDSALSVIDSMQKTVASPDDITVKYDGYPALIFGKTGPTSPFMIVDKHMFNKKNGSGRNIYSVEDFVEYDQRRGVDRSSLYTNLNNIWKPLEQAYGNSNELYWGDLLFGSPVKPMDNQLVFRPNPKGITYRVDVNSDVGQLLKDKSSAIVVHSSLPRAATSTDQAESLRGTVGSLNTGIPSNRCAILSSGMPESPVFDMSDTMFDSVKQLVNQYQDAIDGVTLVPDLTGLLRTYINYKVRTGNLSNLVNDFYQYAESRSFNLGGVDKETIVGIFTIWTKLYGIKMAIWKALQDAVVNGPIKGYLNNGQLEQEGFISDGYKYVNRLGFSRQNLNGQ